MKLGISSYTYAWAVGFEGAIPDYPLTALRLLEKARELGVGLVQFGPNLPLDKLPEKERREVIKRADDWKIDLEMATCGWDMRCLREQIEFAKRSGVILLKTNPDGTGSKLPTRIQMANEVRALSSEFEAGKLRLAIDNSQIPAHELNGILNPIRNPLIGVSLDTLNPLAIHQDWQVAVRVLAHRTLSLHLKDFVVVPAWHRMGFTVEGRPAGQGQLNVPWLVESLAALRVAPSIILESWTPPQKSLPETMALEESWVKQSVDYMRRFIPD